MMRGRAFLCGAGLLALAACSSPEPAFYTLEPVQGAIVSAPARVIEVVRPGLAGYLDRSDIVVKNAGYRLQLTSGARWAEPLGDMIGRVVAQDISQRLPGSSVYAESGAIGADPELRVELNVQRFDQTGDGVVRLIGEVAIEQGRGHRLLHTRQLDVQGQAQPGNVAALAAAMSGLLGQVADQVARDIARG
jgi:uncharacterized protein